MTDEMLLFLNEHFKPVKYDSREMIVEAGGLAKYFYFVLSGVQVLYFIDQKGEKVVLGFSFDGEPTGVYDSFLSQQPSRVFLETLTTSKLIRISRTDYIKLFEKFPDFYIWRTHFMESIFFGRLTREVEMMTMSAKDRYDAFIERCPAPLLQIPQKYLASYLNMQPETFSRLRAQRD